MPSPRPQLAAHRKALGYSQESLAHVIEATTSAIARWERGANLPLARFRRPLAEALELGLPELERMLGGDGVASAPSGHEVPAGLDHYASLEQGAARLQTFEPITLPGLLQTAAYAEAVMRTNWISLSDAVIRERVEARLARQAVLDRQPEPLELCCVIAESVLHRVTGGSETMAAQLGHLLAMTHRSTLQLQVFPSDGSALHMAAFGSFDLFSSKSAALPYMVCTEDLTGFNYLDRPAAIEAHARLFDHLTTEALSSEKSADLINTTMETYQ